MLGDGGGGGVGLGGGGALYTLLCNMSPIYVTIQDLLT